MCEAGARKHGEHYIDQDKKVFGLKECNVHDRIKWRMDIVWEHLTTAIMKPTDVKPLVKLLVNFSRRLMKKRRHDLTILI